MWQWKTCSFFNLIWNYKDEKVDDDDDDDDDDDEEKKIMNYMRRLDGGLFTLQLTVNIILEISANAEPTVCQNLCILWPQLKFVMAIVTLKIGTKIVLWKQ